MALNKWFETQSDSIQEKPSGAVQVGWLLPDAQSGVVYFPPERVRSAQVNREHAKSASRCPAIINLESRYFLIRVPFDLSLQFIRNKDGKPGLKNLAGTASPIRGSKLNKLLHVTSEVEWRYPDKPTIQVSLPYLFLADEPVYISQVGSFMHYRDPPLPGTIFGGRFAIENWPRPLMWAFEWHDTSKPLLLRRGQPWFYVSFETEPQNRAVSLVEAEMTPQLQKFMDHTSAAVNYVNQTFSLFKEAEKVRPKKLVCPVKR